MRGMLRAVAVGAVLLGSQGCLTAVTLSEAVWTSRHSHRSDFPAEQRIEGAWLTVRDGGLEPHVRLSDPEGGLWDFAPERDPAGQRVFAAHEAHGDMPQSVTAFTLV